MNNIIIDQSPILNIAVAYREKDKIPYKVVIDNNFKKSYIGNIYLGRVIQVSEQLDGAFIDIGTEINGFLPQKEAVKIFSRADRNKPISEFVAAGSLILVQVIKDGYQKKGPQLTMDISFPGRYTVLLPMSKGVKYSRKLNPVLSRSEIENIIREVDEDNIGWIVRSRANEIASLDLIKRDAQRMFKVWQNVENSVKLSTKIMKVFEANNFIETIYRLLFDESINHVYFENQALKDALLEIGFPKSVLKKVNPKNALYKEMNLSLKGFLFENLKTDESGFSFTIDELEAFTIIDVNSGQYNAANRKNMIFEVNKKSALAIKECIIARQISGVIIIDFIDRGDQEFLKILSDDIFTKEDDFYISGFTELGLFELTRKRDRQSVLESLSFNFRNKDKLFWELNELYYELLRLSRHTSCEATAVEVDEELYVFLCQNDVFSGIPIKIKISKNNQKNSFYKIDSKIAQ